MSKQTFLRSWIDLNSDAHPLLAPLSQDENNPSLPLPPGAPHPLHQADGAVLRIEANDEVHLSDIQPLFPDTGGHQCVEASLTEPGHHLRHK